MVLHTPIGMKKMVTLIYYLGNKYVQLYQSVKTDKFVNYKKTC